MADGNSTERQDISTGIRGVYTQKQNLGKERKSNNNSYKGTIKTEKKGEINNRKPQGNREKGRT